MSYQRHSLRRKSALGHTFSVSEVAEEGQGSLVGGLHGMGTKYVALAGIDSRLRR